MISFSEFIRKYYKPPMYVVKSENLPIMKVAPGAVIKIKSKLIKMKKTNTAELVLKAFHKLNAKEVYPITYSAIARVIKKDPATVKYHVLALIKAKFLKRDKKTGDIYLA
jgi:predicted CopG family antitoxin